MPIFEYKCETCNETFEVLQANSTPYTNCKQVKTDCEKEGKLHKIISSFAFSGFGETDLSSYQDYCSPNKGTSSGGCGCHGTGSCPGASMLDK